MVGPGRGSRRSSFRNLGANIRALTPTSKTPLPYLLDLLEEALHGPVAPGQAIVGIVTAQNCGKPVPLVSDRYVHPPSHLKAHPFELADHPLSLCLPPDDEAPIQGFVAVVRKAQKIERLGTTKPAFRPAFGGEPAEHEQTGLVLVQRQPEPGQSLLEGRHHPACVALVLEAHDEGVGVADHDHAATRLPATPSLRPEIENVVQDDVGKQRRYQPSHNVAKLPFDLSVRLPRKQFRPGYGEGFLGAPVVICPRSGDSRSGCGGADDPARRDGSESDGAGEP